MLFCPGLVKLMLGHSFGYEAFPYSENIFPFNYEAALKTGSGFIFIPGKNLRAPSIASLNSSLRLYP